jgi:hypothetical protein
VELKLGGCPWWADSNDAVESRYFISTLIGMEDSFLALCLSYPSTVLRNIFFSICIILPIFLLFPYTTVQKLLN